MLSDQGGLLFARPAVVGYVLWLDAAISMALALPGYDDFQSPFWADQRVRELLGSDRHQEAWNLLKRDVDFDAHFEGQPKAAKRFENLFRVPFVSIKVGEYVKDLKESGKRMGWQRSVFCVKS